MPRIRRTSARSPTITPSITSPWPLRYFDALCQTSWAPCSIGRNRHGVANVLSTSRGTPRTASASAGTSVTSTSGFVTLSAMQSFVCGVTAFRTATTSCTSTNVTGTPYAAEKWLSSCPVRPYNPAAATTWSPDFSSASSAAVSAPMPDAQTTPASAPSSRATSAANAS